MSEFGYGGDSDRFPEHSNGGGWDDPHSAYYAAQGGVEGILPDGGYEATDTAYGDHDPHFLPEEPGEAGSDAVVPKAFRHNDVHEPEGDDPGSRVEKPLFNFTGNPDHALDPPENKPAINEPSGERFRGSMAGNFDRDEKRHGYDFDPAPADTPVPPAEVSEPVEKPVARNYMGEADEILHARGNVFGPRTTGLLRLAIARRLAAGKPLPGSSPQPASPAAEQPAPPLSPPRHAQSEQPAAHPPRHAARDTTNAKVRVPLTRPAPEDLPVLPPVLRKDVGVDTSGSIPVIHQALETETTEHAQEEQLREFQEHPLSSPLPPRIARPRTLADADPPLLLPLIETQRDPTRHEVDLPVQAPSEPRIVEIALPLAPEPVEQLPQDPRTQLRDPGLGGLVEESSKDLASAAANPNVSPQELAVMQERLAFLRSQQGDTPAVAEQVTYGTAEPEAANEALEAILKRLRNL